MSAYIFKYIYVCFAHFKYMYVYFAHFKYMHVCIAHFKYIVYLYLCTHACPYVYGVYAYVCTCVLVDVRVSHCIAIESIAIHTSCRCEDIRAMDSKIKCITKKNTCAFYCKTKHD